MAPLIGITTSLSEKPPRRAMVNAAYIEAVQQAGGVPVLLAPHLELSARDQLLSRLAGIVFTGGGDVEPARYGEEAVHEVVGVSALRDQFESDVVAAAMAARLPILAICRGMQIVNVALGGSLVQDIPSQVEGARIHAQEANRPEPSHSVRIDTGSQLARLVRCERLEVNSLHHQAVSRLGTGLVAVAWSEDGLVEAVDLPAYEPFFCAVQWHPEELVGHSKEARALFSSLVDAASLQG